TEPVHLLQIWILPEKRGVDPGYEQKSFAPEEKRGRLRLIADRNGRDGAVTVHQDVSLYASVLEPGQQVEHKLHPGRHAWLQVAQGALTLNGQKLDQGDGAAVSEEETLAIRGEKEAEILLFDLA
ncbi:MAG: pirin family protein, partial [Terriglobales bacterium]